MQIIDCDQNSPEWFEARKATMTASNAQAIGNCGKGLDTYIINLMAEYYSTGQKEQYENEDLLRGHELEQLASDVYELERGVTCKKTGFIKIDDYTGCSPDRLVGEEGLLEIKAPNDTTYFKILLNGEDEIDTKYIWQTQMQMLITGRKWCDLMFYNPNFKTSYKIFRILPDKEKFNALNKGLEIGRKKIQEIKQKINE